MLKRGAEGDCGHDGRGCGGTRSAQGGQQ